MPPTKTYLVTVTSQSLDTVNGIISRNFSRYLRRYELSQRLLTNRQQCNRENDSPPTSIGPQMPPVSLIYRPLRSEPIEDPERADEPTKCRKGGRNETTEWVYH